MSIVIKFVDEDKRELREAMRECRERHCVNVVSDDAVGLAEQVGRFFDGDGDVAATMAGYVALAGELSPHIAMGRHAEAGGVCVVPAWDGEGKRYRFCRWEKGMPMMAGRFKVPEPAEKAWVDKAEISVFLVPGLAFDVAGNRLGHGAGIYDTLLAGASAEAVFIGVAYDDQVVASVPVEAHDIRMHAIATPTKVAQVRRPVLPSSA